MATVFDKARPSILDVSITTERIKVLAQSSTPVALTGTTNETLLKGIPLVARQLGGNKRLRITTLWSHPNSANNKTMRVRLGGLTGTAFQAIVATTSLSTRLQTEIGLVSAASQKANSSATTTIFGSTTGAIATGTVNTNLAQVLAITGQLASGAETLTLESYLVEMIG